MSNENRTNINPPRRMRGPMGGGRMGSGEKAKDFKGTIGKLIRYIGNYKYGVFAVMVCAMFSVVFTVAGPKVLGKATTALSEGIMNKISGKGGID